MEKSDKYFPEAIQSLNGTRKSKLTNSNKYYVSLLNDSYIAIESAEV